MSLSNLRLVYSIIDYSIFILLQYKSSCGTLKGNKAALLPRPSTQAAFAQRLWRRWPESSLRSATRTWVMTSTPNKCVCEEITFIASKRLQNKITVSRIWWSGFREVLWGEERERERAITHQAKQPELLLPPCGSRYILSVYGQKDHHPMAEKQTFTLGVLRDWEREPAHLTKTNKSRPDSFSLLPSLDFLSASIASERHIL